MSVTSSITSGHLLMCCLSECQLEIRQTAANTLSGLIQSSFFPVTPELLVSGRYTSCLTTSSALTTVFQASFSDRANSTDPIIRHGGVLGFSAIVLASPYTVPSYLPDVLMRLCRYASEKQPIRVRFSRGTFWLEPICRLLLTDRTGLLAGHRQTNPFRVQEDSPGFVARARGAIQRGSAVCAERSLRLTELLCVIRVWVITRILPLVCDNWWWLIIDDWGLSLDFNPWRLRVYPDMRSFSMFKWLLWSFGLGYVIEELHAHLIWSEVVFYPEFFLNIYLTIIAGTPTGSQLKLGRMCSRMIPTQSAPEVLRRIRARICPLPTKISVAQEWRSSSSELLHQVVHEVVTFPGDFQYPLKSRQKRCRDPSW